MNQQNNNDDLHVKLCAALLDELPDEERRFVEQALAADPGLRAERDRLQATIGAVRSAFPRPAALPDHLRAALSAAAEQRAATRPKLARRRFAVACSALAASVLVASAVYLAYEPAEAPAPRPAPGAQAPASVTWAASSHATFSVANDSPYNLPCGPRDQLAQAAAGAKSSVVLLAADCSLRSDSVEVLPAPAPNPAPAELDSETQRLLQEFGYVGSGCLTVAAQPPDTAASILESCRRLPGETPSMMYFRFWGDNPFELASLDNLSTFGVDVDTASYALARNYLTRGLIPEKAQVRTEEFVNYFRPDVPPPQDGVFALHLEAAPSLFGGENRWLLRVVLRARETPPAERPPQNITFVIDTSGSMAQENRLELVKHALRLLLTELKEHDRVAIVRFSTDASLVLPLTSVRERALIEEKLFGLAPQQSTNAAAGLALGYQQALSGFDPEARNSVLLLSDGVANTGVTDHEQITRDAAEYRAKGIALNTVGVGMGNHNDVLLEQLADRGDGTCCYVDTPQEAKRALVDRFSGAFVPVARDVKIQVEFDAKRVTRYRLLGYENRAVQDADFRNDAVDAGEIGAGHQVAALYEIEPAPGAEPGSLATARVRHLPPRGQVGEAAEIEQSLATAAVQASYDQGSSGYRRSVLVAQFAEFLRRSSHAQGDSLDLLVHEALKLDQELGDPEFSEFAALADASRELILKGLPQDDPLAQAIDAVHKNAVLRAEITDLARGADRTLLEQLEEENRRLEKKLEELLAERLRAGR